MVSESFENILDAENSKVLTWAILGEGEGHFQDSKSLRSSNLEREFWLLWYQIWRNSSIFRRNFNALNFWGGMPTWEPIRELQKMQFFWSQSSFHDAIASFWHPVTSLWKIMNAKPYFPWVQCAFKYGNLESNLGQF